MYAGSCARISGCGSCPGFAETAELCVTELLANVVDHVPDRKCTVLLWRQATGIRVEVHDGESALPALREVEVRDERGRGLALLAAMAHAWAAEPREPGPGKCVWFEFKG
jgi:hypothetical protein